MAATAPLTGYAVPNQTDWTRAVADPAAAKLARPTPVQYRWQEGELAMFIQLDPATIQGGEYDNGTTPMSDIKFEKLNTDEWCQAAKNFGAKHIVFMLAHSGGFCMWPSKTTDYHIGNTPYKGGKGDVVKEFAASCRKSGVKGGFFFWLPRPKSEGKAHGTVDYTAAKDASASWEDSNRILRTRFNEIMDRLGPDLVSEIWIDQPIRATIGKDIAARAPNTVIFGCGSTDPMPTIRWPGTERGVVDYPAWSTLKRAGIATPKPNMFAADAAQSQKADDPDGDYWAPHEADTPLHEHYWHMRPGALENRKSLDELMECYEKSVGRNSFLIVNCAPQADGSVHPDDLKRYAEFGAEIRRRFGRPQAVVEEKAGAEVTLPVPAGAKVGYVDLWEDYRYGHRIREFVIEGFDGANWVELTKGTAVGRRFLHALPATTPSLSSVRVRVTKSVGTPLIRRLQIHAPAETGTLLSQGKPVEVSGIWPGRETKDLKPASITDGDDKTGWAPDKDARSAWAVVDLGKECEIDRIRFSEPIKRIQAYSIEVYAGGAWKTVGGGLATDHPKSASVRLAGENASKVRVSIGKASDTPVISEIQVFGK